MTTVYLLLGTNMGDRLQLLADARTQIQASCGSIVQQSAIYETAAWGLEDQPDFLNMVVNIQTYLSPLDLLHATQKIENSLGRQRHIKWGQRTLDIDILLYGSSVIELPNLTIPHPFLQKRRFTLAPLAEIAVNIIHPVLHQSTAQLLAACTDPLPVYRTNYILPSAQK